MTTPKVALVTGSGKRRVGWHVAAALAERGYALAIHYYHSAAEAAETIAALQALGVQAAGFQADVGDEQAVRSMMLKLVNDFGRLDVLVNCAAIWQKKRLEDVTAADVRRHFEINALGSFLCAQQAGLVMVKQPEGGVIVNLGDWAEVRPLCRLRRLLSLQGSSYRHDALPGSRTGDAQPAYSGQLHPAGTGPVALRSA